MTTTRETQSQTTDRIEKKALLRAPRARVWQALTDLKQFNAWFGVNLAGERMQSGATLRGNITHPGYEHLQAEIRVEAVEPESKLSYRWHPHAIDAKVDYSREPMTLVEFLLEENAGDTELTIVESGFDQIPTSRRALAFRMNGEGWAQQLKNIERHVTRT